MVTDKDEQLDEFLDEGDDQSDAPSDEEWSSYEDQDIPDSAGASESGATNQNKRKKQVRSAKILMGAIVLVGGVIVFLRMGQQANLPAPAVAPQMTEQQTWSVPSTAPVGVTDVSVPPMPATIEQAGQTEQGENVQPEETMPPLQRGVDVVDGQTPRMPKASDVLLKSSANADGIGDLSEKIDQLISRLDKVESNQAEVAALEESVRVLEKKVVALSASRMAETKQPTPSGQQKQQSSVPPPPIVSSVSEAIVLAPAPVVPPRMPVEEDLTPATAVSPTWILKGAQPGRAMVSRPGESDMRTIEVGSILAGIGQVTDISYRDGRWVVTGTKGRITQ